MLSFCKCIFITFFTSSLLFFCVLPSHAQSENKDFLPHIISLLLAEQPEQENVVVFDAPISSGVFIVPDGITSINVVAFGASGADGDTDGQLGGVIIEDGILQSFFPGASAGAGGAGGKSEGSIPVTPGEQLRIIVGSEGTTSVDGGGNGGGLSGILRDNDALIIAGGGGGGGRGDAFNSVNGGNGGNGGGLFGENGDDAQVPIGLSLDRPTTGYGGGGAEEEHGGSGRIVLAGTDEDGRFGLFVKGCPGGSIGIVDNPLPISNEIGAPLFAPSSFGGSAFDALPFSPIGGGGRASFAGGGGAGYNGGGAGSPVTYIVGPVEIIVVDCALRRWWWWRW